MPLFSRFRSAPSRPRLHVGSGRARLEGWVNIDIQQIPGVDVVADVTQGLQFENAEAVFAEHFLEHLAIDDAIKFLLESHRVLGPGGWLRLSTPNLDWVWVTHYRLAGSEDEKRHGALALNRAFHGWRHQFLWNREMLGEALAACGFEPVRWCRYGESALPVFQGIERHETYEDEPDLPHVIIAEASKGAPQPERLERFRELVQRQLLDHMAD
jgi:predicted SAM-dependent methyltransferase